MTNNNYFRTDIRGVHTPSFFSSKVFRVLSRIGALAYIMYASFSPVVFASEAEAPETKTDMIITAEVLDNGKSEEDEELVLAAELPHDAHADEELIDERVEKIRAYYARQNLPLADYAEDFVASADEHDIDWRLVAAIGFIESTGGKHACITASYSPFGWGSCRINFDSYEHAIDVVSWNLAGDNPNTRYAYAGKDTRGILQAYNPPSVVPDYADRVMYQMDIIDSMEIEI